MGRSISCSIGLAVVVAGAMGVPSADAGGSVGFSFGYAGGPGYCGGPGYVLDGRTYRVSDYNGPWRYPRASYAYSRQTEPVIISSPVFVTPPCEEVPYVRRGDYYRHPTGVRYRYASDRGSRRYRDASVRVGGNYYRGSRNAYRSGSRYSRYSYDQRGSRRAYPTRRPRSYRVEGWIDGGGYGPWRGGRRGVGCRGPGIGRYRR